MNLNVSQIEQCSATTDDGHYFLFFPKIVMRTYVSLIKLSDIYGKTNFRLWQHLFCTTGLYMNFS